MNRLLLLAVLSTTSVLLLTAPASAENVVATSTLSSSVTPKRDRAAPFKLKVTGRLSFPSTFCGPYAPGSLCVPLLCPGGIINPAYCTKPPVVVICVGSVRVVVRIGLQILTTRTVGLSANCRFGVNIGVRLRARLRVSARFLGNSLLGADSAVTKIVRTG